jgi:hypothetical protein
MTTNLIKKMSFVIIAICLTISFVSCTSSKKEVDLVDAKNAIKNHLLKSKPALRGKNFSIIDGGLKADDVCACIKVCDGNGNNCTECVCSPAGCSTCD